MRGWRRSWRETRGVGDGSNQGGTLTPKWGCSKWTGEIRFVGGWGWGRTQRKRDQDTTKGCETWRKREDTGRLGQMEKEWESERCFAPGSDCTKRLISRTHYNSAERSTSRQAHSPAGGAGRLWRSCRLIRAAAQEATMKPPWFRRTTTGDWGAEEEADRRREHGQSSCYGSELLQLNHLEIKHLDLPRGSRRQDFMSSLTSVARSKPPTTYITTDFTM